MNQAESSQRTFLKDIEVEARIGLHPWERHEQRPTRLLVSVELVSDVLVSFQPGTPHGFIDYDIVRNFVRGLKNRPHTELLEALAQDIIALCMTLEHVTACGVAIRKPDIFNDTAEAGVEIFLTKAAYLRKTGRPA